jgi:hypothetical protein
MANGLRRSVSPQIFGRIVLDAGIEGILYDSALTQSQCSAIYPHNLQNSSSYIEMDDPCPPEVIKKANRFHDFQEFHLRNAPSNSVYKATKIKVSVWMIRAAPASKGGSR